MESSNVVIDDTRLKSNNYEDEVVLDDDSPLERVVVTPNVGTSNDNNEVTQPITRVPLLDSNEPTTWVRRLHNKEDVIGDVNEGVRTRHQIANLISYTCYISQIEPETNYCTVCIKLSRGGLNRYYAFYLIFRVSQNYENALKII